jgi:23S rRNA pseudouridine2604 synthase
LIRGLNISKKNALTLIQNGEVFLNDICQRKNCFFEKTDTIRYQNTVLQEGKKIVTLAIYKPRGIETTLNVAILNNLTTILPIKEHLFPIGRLDKDSEGLLLLTNDGRLYRSLLHYGQTVEKEYIVTVDL